MDNGAYMKRKAYIFLILTLICTVLGLVGCDDGDNGTQYYYPDVLTVHFYDNPNEPPIGSVTVRLSECGDGETMGYRVWENMPIIEKDGYFFQGYMLNSPEFYPISDMEHFDNVMLKPEKYMDMYPTRDDWDKYYAFYYQLYLDEKVEIMEMNLYANYVPYIYRFNFDGLLPYSTPTNDSEVKRVDRPYELAKYNNTYKGEFRATIDYLEYAPGGFNATKEVAGWRTSGGDLIFDYTGRPTLSPYEAFLKFTNYEDRHNPNYSFHINDITLYPVLVDKFSVITLDYGIAGVENDTVMVTDGVELSSLKLPGKYAGGKYTVGWSVSSSENIAPSGVAYQDITLYPIWTTAKRVSVNYSGAPAATEAYILLDGRIIYDRPDGLEKYEIESWHADEQLTSSFTPTYASVSDGAELYVKWQLEQKSITVNPMNGDAPCEITLHRNAENNEFELPSWAGHEIVGWYTNRECTGEGISLDFFTVEDGATYYAKWVKTN